MMMFLLLKYLIFGLVKVIDSNLTATNSEKKGYFNDPALVFEGFKIIIYFMKHML